ncbi:ImmA/IrrE family metallo-endopeptidase [Methylobacillus sp. Pita2]|uniref:ImmA/IrrE family metallo-endopeptidase n=1 Tax=Methylobacillus sp. Pita2 TaxID=3383245 RepID=UPI0038B689DC
MGAIHGVFGRSTVIHELAHIVLQHHITFNRNRGVDAATHKHYEDSEWQAKSLTAAIMMPIGACSISNNDPRHLSMICGTSEQAAQYRLETYNKRIAQNLNFI